LPVGGKSLSESLINKPIEIYRAFSSKDSEQTIKTHHDGTWRVSDLKALVAEEGLEVFDFPLQLINLHTQSFAMDDLYEFLQHVRMCESVNMDEPIILSHRGQILDGRHRICNAILAGKTHIKAVKFTRDIKPSHY
jgi:hypothetical protein